MSAPGPAYTPRLELIDGDEGFAHIRDEQFAEKWSALATACPWSTSCQSWAFAETWFTVYRELYRPLLIVQYDSLGELAGLLPLAIEKSSGAIVHVGARQAEYQVWLARPRDADTFIEQALDELARRFPEGRLILQYLPPGSPIRWCSKGERWSSRVILREKRRPLMALGEGSRVEESMRKKSNKSRINRLKKVAPLSLVRMRAPAELHRVLDTIAEFCDLRQGAVNSSLPFRSDPYKKEFCLRMLEKQDLLHASVLMSGETVVAANLGLISGTSVAIGVLAHSPFLAEHSPGKLLILLLARDLGQQGFQYLDLTPGGDLYKERSADSADQVHILTIDFDPVAHNRELAVAHLGHVAKRMLGARATDMASQVRRLKEVGPTGLMRSGIRNIYSRTTFRYYIVRPDEARQITEPAVLNVNCIADILDYEPSRPSDLNKVDFLSDAAKRLESGERSYTLSENGLLLHCAWLHFDATSVVRSGSLARPPNTCLITEGFTHRLAQSRNLRRVSLAQRLQDAAAMPGVEAILIRMPENDVFSQQNVDARFRFYGSETRKIRFGIDRTVSCLMR